MYELETTHGTYFIRLDSVKIVAYNPKEPDHLWIKYNYDKDFTSYILTQPAERVAKEIASLIGILRTEKPETDEILWKYDADVLLNESYL